jgi:hypothetical protein
MRGQTQPAHDGTIEWWIGKERVRRDDGDTAVILRGDKNDLVLVNHQTRTYSVVGLPLDFAALLPADVRARAEMWKLTARVATTDESKKIGDWNARLFEVELTNPAGLAIRTELWATRDLPIDYDRFQRLSLTLAAMQPGGAEGVAELAKVDGFPVYQVVRVDMGGTTARSSEKLESAEEKDPPAGLYDPPAGYAEEPFNPGAPPGRGP